MTTRIIGICYRRAASAHGPETPTLACSWSDAAKSSWYLTLPTVADEKRFIGNDLQSGDVVLMATGKRSDPMAYAIAYRGFQTGVAVWRIKTDALRPFAANLGGDEAKALVNVFRFQKHFFTQVTRKEAEAWRRKHKLDQTTFRF